MNFTPLPLEGAYLIDLESMEDSRGFFARTFCRNEFIKAGLNPRVEQTSISFNRVRGVTRGLHFQLAPFEEVRLVRCLAGAIFDVILDIRETSETYGQWEAVELSSSNQRAIYIPEGFAHGFQTLEDCSLVYYQMSAPYAPQAVRGIRWDDPELAIEWPLREGLQLSRRDLALPSWRHWHNR